MKKYLLNLFAKYVMHIAVASNGKCWNFAYSEKVPEDFDQMICELRGRK